MPRQARAKSEFGIYHVMMRGINRQNIFDDEEDYNHFIRILSSLPFAKNDVGDSCQRHNCTIYAWCLMTRNIPEFQLLPRDVQDMAVRSILDAGTSVRQTVSYTQDYPQNKSKSVMTDSLSSPPSERAKMTCPLLPPTSFHS